MRVLLGLSALAALGVANAATSVTVNTSPVYGNSAVSPPNGVTALLSSIVVQQTQLGGNAATISPTVSSVVSTNTGFVPSSNFFIYVGNSITAVSFTIVTNAYTGQLQYRWNPNYSPGAAYTCDPCSDASGVGTLTSCSSESGPGSSSTNGGVSPAAGFKCASLTRSYLLSGLVVSPATTTFGIQTYDLIQPYADHSSYAFTVVRAAPTVIVGDPQIVGMQGQDFQVHGVPDEIFNIVTYPSLQINARFTYLESGACHDNFTACFAHPGTYISEEGIRIGKDKVRVSAGSFKKGLTVHVNGKKIKSNTDLKQGAVEMVNHRRVVVHTDVMRVAISNSDFFLNQELELMDDKLVSLGSKRVTLKDNQKFHSEVPLHGLQGQTWRNVEYPSGLEYEGSIMDYHIVDGNLFGTDFVFNQFQS